MHRRAILKAAAPPLGGLAAVGPNPPQRLFASPGPIYELETGRADYWRSARALHAAGFRAGEVVHNCFSYHLSPGGWILDAGLRALGCVVVSTWQRSGRTSNPWLMRPGVAGNEPPPWAKPKRRLG